MLSVEDIRSTEVISRLTWLGISERTIRSAQKELGVEAYRKSGVWYLRLSDAGKQSGAEIIDE